MPLGVSVVICCHNSAERLPEHVGAFVSAQKVPAGLLCEVLVVDNASTDATAEVARQHWPKDAPAPLRVVHEPQPGLTHARQRGFSEARHEIISFIDDDNWVCPNGSQPSPILDDHPHRCRCVRRTGGEAEPEIDSPWWFETFQGHFAVWTTELTEAGRYHVDARGYLWGAGLAILQGRVVRVDRERI